MPPPESDPPSSEPVIGSPATGAISLATQNRVFDLGERMMTRVFKRSEEASDYVLDMREWLSPGERITGVTAVPDRPGLALVQLTFTNTAVALRAAAGADGVRYVVSIILSTSRGRGRTVRFTMQTAGLESIIAVSPDFLDFPNTTVDETSPPQTIIVTNVGDSPIAIQAVTVTGEFVQTNTLGESIAANRSRQITVRFQPTSEGAKTGRIDIITSAAQFNRYISLSGIAVAPAEPDYQFAFDFIGVVYEVSGATVPLASAVSVMRASAALALDINGAAVDFSTNLPRVTTGKGLVLDPPRQNVIENAKDMSGAAVGVIGAGGALPDGWYVSEGVDVEVLAITVGPTYTTIELELHYDNSEGLDEESPRLRFAAGNGVPALPGEAWAASVFGQVVESNARRVRLALLPRNDAGSSILSTYASVPTVFDRVGVSAVCPPATVEVETAVQLTVLPETDTTVRLKLALPVLEKGAGVTSPLSRTGGVSTDGTNLANPSFTGAQEGVVGETTEGWERGANALTAPDMEGATEGTVGSGGAMPNGWFNSSNIDTIEVLDVETVSGAKRVTLRLTRVNDTGSNQTMQVRLEEGNGKAATAGERWTLAMRSEILAGGAANPRLTIYARNSGGSSLLTNSVSLAGGGAETEATLTMPANTAYATPAIQATAAPSSTTVVELTLWLPHFAEDVGEALPAGILPTGWSLDGIDFAEIGLGATLGGLPAMDLTLGIEAAEDGQVRFVSNTAVAGAPGERWVARIRSSVLSADEGTDLRLGIAARNSGGAIIGSDAVSLPTAGGDAAVYLVLPTGTAYVTGRIGMDGPGEASIRIAKPVLAKVTSVGATTGQRSAEAATVIAALGGGAAGTFVLEAEERAGSGDGVIASLAFDTHTILVMGGGDPGIRVETQAGTLVAQRRFLPAITSAIVRCAVSWAAGRIRFAFSAALDRANAELTIAGFAPTAAPTIRFGADRTGNRPAVTAIRSAAVQDGERTLEQLLVLAADPGLPIVPSPWRLYRHAWVSPPLASVPAAWYWEPETYDTSDETIGWIGGGGSFDDLPESQTVPPDMIVPSMYGPPNPENPGRDIVHEPSFALFTAIVTPIRQAQKDLNAATDAYLASGTPSVAYAAAGWIYQAAVAGVLTGNRNDTGTAQIERWLGCAGGAWLKICRGGFGTPSERAVIEQHFRDLADEMIAFQLRKRLEGSSYAINNHYFWAAWGIAVVGVILGEDEYIDFGVECLWFAIDAAANQGAIIVELEPDGDGEFPDDSDPEGEEVEGSQPAEIVRLTRALHYHNFAMPPLVALAEIAIARGLDPYARRDGMLHKMAKFTVDAVDEPELITAVQEAVLGPGKGAVQDTSMWTGPTGIVDHALPNGSQMSWAWIYSRRFPDSDIAKKWGPRFYEKYSSVRSNNLGGDMRLLYPWRHPKPALLTITGGATPTTTTTARTLAGTAEPGAIVQAIVGTHTFTTTAHAITGAWSITLVVLLAPLAAGTYAVKARQTTALGTHPPVAATLTITS